MARGRFWLPAPAARLYPVESHAHRLQQRGKAATGAPREPGRRQPAWLFGSPLTPSSIIYLQRAAGNMTVSRLIDPVENEWLDEPPPQIGPPELSQKDVIEAETTAMADTLKSFREIQVTVEGPLERIPVPWSPFEGGLTGGAEVPTFVARRSKTVTVHAAYFINTTTAQAAYHQDPNFAKVQAALKQKSLIEYAEGKPYSSGMAVKMGKSTPADVKAFVEEALRQDVIRKYAHATDPYKGQFPAGKNELVDLPEATLQGAIQQWITDNGVGVDCSGFVLQAAIAVREKIKAVAKQKGMAVPAEYAGDIKHTERSAASFASGTARAAPTDIKLGDAWVIGTTHVRIVASTPIEADDQIQFDADESQGDSSHTTVGPTTHTWRTHSKTAFNTMLRLKDGGDPSKKADYEAHGQGNHHFYAIT